MRSTFQQLLDSARRELAHHYLGQSSVVVEPHPETAHLLGYEDPTSLVLCFPRMGRRFARVSGETTHRAQVSPCRA